MKRHASIGILLCTLSLLRLHGPLVAAADEPETVMATFHAKPGAEAALAKVIADHFVTARQLNLVLAEPHVTIRMNEGDKAALVDIFTWRDGSIPDDAPTAIRALWTEMARLTEARGGKPAIDIVQVALVR
jgi:hypothetical protein